MTERVLGIDVGGTFTDFALLQDGRLRVHKVPTTPSDPSAALLHGIRDMGLLPDGLAVVHGTTVATNALLERRGARTALVTTAGFEDVIEIGRQDRADIYDLNYQRPEPLVDRDLRFGVNERLDAGGGALTALTPREARRVAKLVRDSGAAAVAVSLLFSFRNPEHELLLLETLRHEAPDLFYSLSSAVMPEFREYERTSTTVINAYVGPLMQRYLDRLGETLGETVRVMQSSGGSITAGLAARQPVRTILSGPAGGVVGAFSVAREATYPDVITLDMGGTSTDVSLCPGRIKETVGAQVAGMPVGVPMIDIHTVGAGGGSIARVDSGGALRVGPASAGADPGPACYGRGDDVTVTDANVVLGRIQPEHFLGGRMRLDVDHAHRALERLARQLGTDTRDAALGVTRVVNANMERAIRAISLERGYDPRTFTLLPFGGAGPLYACELAASLRIPRVLVPRHPGILSAVGVAIADIVKDYSRTVLLRGGDLTRDRLEAACAALQEAGRADFVEEGLPLDGVTVERRLDVRYVGQSFELTVDYPAGGGPVLRRLTRAFNQAHQQRFGYSDPREPIEVVNVRLKMVVPSAQPEARMEAAHRGDDGGAARTGESRVLFAGGEAVTPWYHRELLRPGAEIDGPALVLQMDATVLVPPGWRARVDPYRNLVLVEGA